MGEVFISYAHGGESEEIANSLGQALQKRGIKLVWDQTDLGYKGLIREFMQQIGQGRCVVAVISDKYLKCKNCMFELLEISRNGQFYHRIFPIVLSDAQIYAALERLNYIKYWEGKIGELNEAMKGVNQANLQGFREEIDLYTDIRNKIAGLVDTLQNMNTLTPEMHRQESFKEVVEAINRRLNQVDEEMPEIKEGLRPTSQGQHPRDSAALISQSAGKGLSALKDLMSNPLVYAEVKAGKDKLQEACNQIKIISTYKDVHDQLHTLEFECYQALLGEVRFFAIDLGMVLDNLGRYKRHLERINSMLESYAKREIEGTPILKEIDWFEDLKQAQIELNESIETENIEKLKKTIYLLNTVLTIQPTVIDTNLKIAADALSLPILVKQMSSIREKLTQVELPSDQESRKIHDFQEGVQSLEDLHNKLVSFISGHNAWQKIELELRRIQLELDSNPPDINALKMSWLRLKPKLEKQYCNCEADWAKQIKKAGDNLDKNFTSPDTDPAKIKRVFQTYRGQASNHFFIVDKELNEFCGQLRDHINTPLTSIMEMIAL